MTALMNNILNSNIKIIIQARVGSMRLPSKSLAQIGDYKLIEWVILRIISRFKPQDVILATTLLSEDDAFESICTKYSINIFRGSENNVFSRFKFLACKYGINSTLIRVCADNPFVSPDLIFKTVNYYESKNLEYCHSLQELPIFPYVDGLGVEVFSSEMIANFDESKLDSYDREHVTSFFKKNDIFHKRCGMPTPDEYKFPRLSLDIDNLQDLNSIRELIKTYQITIKSSDSKILLAANNFFN